MESYELLISKSKENIETAELLFNHGKLGLAAFNAQQSIELAIKSYVIKYNLLEGVKKENLFKTHLPSKILLKNIFRYLINESDRLESKKKTKKWLLKIINQSTDNIHKTTSIMKKVDSSEAELENLWKMSLGIKIEDSRVLTYFKELLEPDETISSKMTVEIIREFQQTYDTVMKEAVKHRLSHKIPEIQKEATIRAKKYGIPERILKMFFEQEKPEIIIQEIKKLDPNSVDVIGGLYDKGGIADMREKLIKDDDDGKQKEQQIMLRIKYLEQLNYIVLLTYPHEQLGRYAKIIDGKNTEQWYSEKKEALEIIIDECRAVFERTYAIVTEREKNIPLPKLTADDPPKPKIV